MQSGFRNLATVLTMACAFAQVAGAANGSSRDFPWGPTVIYGEDNRLDLYQVSKQLHLDLADSTVALIKKADVKDNLDGTSTLNGKNFGEEFNLCTTEPFREQSAAAFCSGFLVDADTVVTAGHCIEGPSDCADVSFVFGYNVKEAGGAHTKVKTEDVYTCERVVHTEVNGRGADFAVVKLNRRVMNHRATELRQSGSLVKGDEIVVIGHPSGLPTKVAAGAAVRSIESGFFMANLDTYGGNSGSAVFNDRTGQVEGILVRGEQDFAFENGCVVSNKCPADGCRGEDVTLISSVLPHLGTAPVDPPVDPVTPPVPPVDPVTPPAPPRGSG